MEIKQVLLVDDEDMIRQLAELSLSQFGDLEVCSCNSGESAIEKLETFSPQLILLDANMPGLSGPETLEAIRRNHRFVDTPVVFITGESRASEIQRLKDLGAADVIVKPFDPMTLAEQVKKIGHKVND